MSEDSEATNIRSESTRRAGSFYGVRGLRANDDAHAAHEPGQTIGEFKLVELIGQGGMGEVWLAEQSGLGRSVALKLVRPERVDEASLEFFAREARASGRLAHAGIVAVHGSGVSDGIHWIAQELVEGSWTLRDFIDDLRNSAGEPADYYRNVAKFMAELADALEAAHAAGVIHRDLKPGNVLVTRTDRPKLTDFGLARITDESALSQTGDVAGTYLYMSPEQVLGRRAELDHRTDIFSFGVVLYEMLALRRPFEGDTTNQIAEQILEWDPPDLQKLRSRVPRDLAAITGKAIAKRQTDRYQSMGEVAAELRRFLAHEPIHAKPPGKLQRAQKWMRRNPTKSVAGVAAAALFVTVSVLLDSNVRANEALTTRSVELENTNALLATKTEEARLNAEREATRSGELRRLSDLQEYEDLVAEADALWPPSPTIVSAYEDWIERARALVAKRPTHEETLARIRAAALPRTPEDAQREREAHPANAEFEQLQAQRAVLAQRVNGEALELPELDLDVESDEPYRLVAEAQLLVSPDRVEFGQEARGLALALYGMEIAESEGFSSDSTARICTSASG